MRHERLRTAEGGGRHAAPAGGGGGGGGGRDGGGGARGPSGAPRAAPLQGQKKKKKAAAAAAAAAADAQVAAQEADAEATSSTLRRSRSWQRRGGAAQRRRAVQEWRGGEGVQRRCGGGEGKPAGGKANAAIEHSEAAVACATGRRPTRCSLIPMFDTPPVVVLDDDGNRALHYAAYYGDLAAVEIVVRACAEHWWRAALAPNKHGETLGVWRERRPTRRSSRGCASSPSRRRRRAPRRRPRARAAADEARTFDSRAAVAGLATASSCTPPSAGVERPAAVERARPRRRGWSRAVRAMVGLGVMRRLAD